MRIRVPISMQVAALVDGDAPDRELDVLSFARIEASQEDLLRMPLSAFVRQQNPRSELEEVTRVPCGTLESAPTCRLKSEAPTLGGAERPRTSTSSGAFCSDAMTGCVRRPEGATGAAAGTAVCVAIVGSTGGVGATSSGAGAGGAK